MKRIFSAVGAVGFVFFFLAAPSVDASGNSYFAPKKAFNGKISLVSAADRSPIGEAFIASRNVATSSLQIVGRVVEPGSANNFQMANATGDASLSIIPFGKFWVWKPGFWPEEVKFRFKTSEHQSLDPQGKMIIALKPATSSERAAAAKRAAELFGFIRRDGTVEHFVGADADPSEQVRRKMKEAIRSSGGLP